MNRKSFIEKVAQLAEEAKSGGEMEAASILFALAGSLAAQSERQLMEVCAAHAHSDVMRITANRN